MSDVLLSRWFFQFVSGAHKELDQQLKAWPCTGRFDSSIFLSEDPQTSILIGLEPGAWKLDAKTHWRTDIRSGLSRITGQRFPSRTSGRLCCLWTRSNTFLDGIPMSVMDESDARLQAGLSWHWIGRVLSFPIAEQRVRGFIFRGFDQWLKTAPSNLPSNPVKRKKRLLR